MTPAAKTTPALAALRSELSALDADLIRLLARRVDIARRIGVEKRAAGLPTLDPRREAQVVASAARAAREVGLVHVRGGPEEGGPAGEHLVEHRGRREDVGAPVHRQPAGHLRAHVAELPAQHPILPRPHPVGGAGDAEVDELHLALEGEQHVLGRDVAVDDAEELVVRPAQLVRGVEPLAEVGDDPRRRGRQESNDAAESEREGVSAPPIQPRRGGRNCSAGATPLFLAKYCASLRHCS